MFAPTDGVFPVVGPDAHADERTVHGRHAPPFDLHGERNADSSTNLFFSIVISGILPHPPLPRNPEIPGCGFFGRAGRRDD